MTRSRKHLSVLFYDLNKLIILSLQRKEHLFYAPSIVIRLGAKLLCLQALIFRELRVLLFQSVPILVPLLDPPALTRSLMCGNVLQS